jgi:hypothetical protein
VTYALDLRIWRQHRTRTIGAGDLSDSKSENEVEHEGEEVTTEDEKMNA